MAEGFIRRLPSLTVHFYIWDNMTTQEFYNSMITIGGRIRSMLDVAGSTSFIYGNVESVDQDSDSISVRVGTESGDLVISDISLGPNSGASTCVISYPTVGSLVVIGLPYKQPESAFVALFSQLDSVKIVYNKEASEDDADIITADNNGVSVERGKYSCTITKDSINLSCSDGATIVLSDNSITLNGGNLGGLIKISDLVSAINSMVNTFNGHTHNYSATTSAGVTQATMSTMNTISVSDIEDTNVTH